MSDTDGRHGDRNTILLDYEYGRERVCGRERVRALASDCISAPT